MRNNKHRGHAIYFDEKYKKWRYEADDLPVESFWQGKPCGHCNEHNTPEGHDPCLGTIPNVTNACCGHGEELEAYAILSNGRRVAGAEAVAFFQRRGT